MIQHGHSIVRTMAQDELGRPAEAKQKRGWDSHHHEQPMVAATSGPWWGTRLWWLSSAPAARFFFATFWLGVLVSDFAIQSNVFGCKRGHIPFFHHSSSSSFSFQIDQRQRGRGKDCTDSMPGLRLNDSSTILAKHCFSFSSLFLILDLYL